MNNVHRHQSEAIRAYQYYGDTKSGTPSWKLLRLDRIDSWQPTDTKFDVEPQARGWAAQAFNGADKMLPTIFKVVDLGEEPMTDLERLQARTRQLKQSKPVNITQINTTNTSKDSPTVPQEKETGPLGGKQPETGVPTPQKSDIEKVNSKPLNTDGTEKNDESQPPVRQEPKQTGPIIGNPTNPEENNSEELMSNDQFRDMLRRNLELTDKEKEKRGFNLQNQE